MTNDEIVKSLEVEVHQVEYIDGSYADGVDIELLKDVIALIKRQKAYIECLNTELEAITSQADLLKADYMRLERLRAESINAVKVIRCKDCIYYETGKDYTPYCNYINGLDEAKEDDFCSYGEKCNS